MNPPAQVCDVVHAFEPSPSTYHYLAMNTAVASNIKTHNVGLGAEQGESELTFSPDNRSGGFVSNQMQASAGHTIETITIRTMDQMVRSAGLSSVDFVKMDVEGFEVSVIRGAPETLRRFRPTFVMEMNHWCLNAFQRMSVPDFLDVMRAAFPVLYAVQGNTYADLHNPDYSYIVMYRHILQGQYATLVGTFDAARLSMFSSLYSHGID
ncbi:FkbM family methyltransferase [Rhodanobacter thiooxydans]|uniref:FkbM family methyltransferase n=1 Tax=Rhodanobacter thiooxydans TaxID=416169 RepID=UPI0009EE6D04|nr:FkbM family methyltransferase [Rhodanobacter thiooxydans]